MRKLLLATAVSFAACGGGGDGTGSLGDDGTGGDDTATVDGGRAASGKVGTVWVSTWSYAYSTGTFAGTSLSASFFPQTPSTWTDESSGCSMTTYTTDGGTQTPQTSAGTLKFGTSPVTTLTPDANGTYTAATMDHAIATGTNISIDASGATVPAFSTSIVVPPSATLTQPAIVDGKLTIDRATDLVVKWTGGGGDITISVGSVYTGGSTYVNCTFPASAHQGTVPASMMTQLGAGTGAFGASLSSKAQKDAGDWTVWIGATSSVTTTDGASAAANATLE